MPYRHAVVARRGADFAGRSPGHARVVQHIALP